MGKKNPKPNFEQNLILRRKNSAEYLVKTLGKKKKLYIKLLSSVQSSHCLSHKSQGLFSQKYE